MGHAPSNGPFRQATAAPKDPDSYRMAMQGIKAPEPSASALSRAKEAPDKEMLEADLNSHMSEQVSLLDHNARLFFELDDTGATNNLYSFHCEYVEYLEDRNLVDVSAPRESQDSTGGRRAQGPPLSLPI